MSPILVAYSVDDPRLPHAGNRTIEYLHLQFLEVDSREHRLSLTISADHAFSLIVYGKEYSQNAAVGVANASEAPCSNVLTLPIVSRAGIAVCV